MDPPEPEPRPPAISWQAPPDRHFSLDDIIPRPILRGLVRIVRLPAGPILLALLFGLTALPTALVIPTYDMSISQDWIAGGTTLPPLGPAALLASLSAVLGAVFVAAPVGWLIVRRHLILGGLVSIGVAWIAAIVALPVLPSLFGLSYGAIPGLGESSYPQIVGITGGVDILTSGFPDLLLATLIISGLIGALSLGALVVGVAIWAPLVRRRTT
jgi:hypothetical protein